MEKTILSGEVIMTDDDARDLRIYLEHTLTREERATIFGWARYKGTASFQDDERHHYTVSYADGVHTVTALSH